MPPKKKGAAASAGQKKGAKGDGQANKITKTNDASKDRSEEESTGNKPSADQSGEKETPEKLGDKSAATEAAQNHEGEASKSSSSSRKRKQAPDEPSTASPPKAVRRSNRSVSPTQSQLLNYLMSESCAKLCRPADEQEAIDSDYNYRAYTSITSRHEPAPFVELLSAVVLSRPISHRLGLRTIRTLLNKPYNFEGAYSITESGTEKLHEALEHAKTQHKAKTAEQLVLLAEYVARHLVAPGDDSKPLYRETWDDRALGPLMEREDVDEALAELQKSIKGLGTTGIDIFRRRVQGDWPAAYPFVDDRSAQALKKIGLPADAMELRNAIKAEFETLELGVIEGRRKAEKMMIPGILQRKVLVVLLERATGADLEGRIDEVRRRAAEWKPRE